MSKNLFTTLQITLVTLVLVFGGGPLFAEDKTVDGTSSGIVPSGIVQAAAQEDEDTSTTREAEGDGLEIDVLLVQSMSAEVTVWGLASSDGSETYWVWMEAPEAEGDILIEVRSR